MASPQLEDGFCTLALELHAALDVADFAKFERMILSLLIAAQYGPERLRGLDLDPIKLAGIAFCNPSNFRKAIKSLAACGAIARNPDSSYRIVKDWEAWRVRRTDRDEDRIDPGDRSFVAYVAGHFGLKKPSTRKRTPKATRPQESPKVEATRPQQSTKVGAGWPPVDADESDKYVNGSHDTASGSVEALAGGRVRPSEDKEDKREEYLGLAAKEEAGGLPEGLGEEPTPGRRRKARIYPADPAADRLVAWVRGRLADLEYDAEALADAEALCRGWVACGGNPEWGAQAFQAAIDAEDVLDKTPYTRGILRRMFTENRDGLAVLAPAFCDFRADPGAAPTPPAPSAPAPRPGYAQRSRADREAFLATFRRSKPITQEATDGDRA